MNYLSEYHQYLLAGKITDSLSESEKAEFDELFLSDNEVQKAYEETIAELPQDLVNNHFEHIKQPGFWKDIQRKHTLFSASVWSFRNVAVAAVSLGILIGAGFWLLKDTKEKTPSIAAKPANEIQLKMANGRTINLTKQQGNIKEGTATLINNNESLRYTDSGTAINGINSVFVPESMDYKIVLSDGSEVWMNSVTQLDFPFRFTGNTREITLSGEAYLKIARDKSKPFIVHLPHSTVKVLGTEFNVNSYDSAIDRVALVEGSVNMASANESINLVPGKQGIRELNGSITTHNFDNKSVLSWRKGLHYFNNADLNEIGSVLKRWYGKKVIIDNPLLAQKRIRGVLNKNRPLDVFLEDLKIVAKVNTHIDSQGVLHFK